MRRGLTALAMTLMVSAPAMAAPITVWLQDEAPDDKAVGKADLQTGGTAHLWNDDLRYPPMPQTPADREAVAALDLAVEDGLNRWEGFEVELGIAEDIQAVIDRITLLQGDQDREDLVEALLFQGTALTRYFGVDGFATDPAAAPYRLDVDGVIVPKAWAQAYAIAGSSPGKGALIDAVATDAYRRYAEAITGLPKASLALEQGVGEVWIDGKPVTGETLSLAPGTHWVHVMRGGVVHGRSRIEAEAGGTYVLPRAVSDDDIAAARQRVLAEHATGMPKAVDASLSKLAAFRQGAVFLGAMDGNKPVLVSYDASAELKDTTLVTGLLFGELGGGVLMSPVFEEYTNGAAGPRDASLGQIAGAGMGGIGFELGVSYFLLTGGLDVAFTPGNTIRFSSGVDTNDSVAIFPQPWIGIGAYAIRPTKATPTFAIAASVGWLAPAHLGVGGRMTVGIPIDDNPSWVRITLGGDYGPPVDWTPNDGPMIRAFLRFGFGARVGG